MQHIVVILYQRFRATYQSHLQGSRSPGRMPVTLRYAVYVGKVVGGDWLLVSMMPSDLVDTV